MFITYSKILVNFKIRCYVLRVHFISYCPIMLSSLREPASFSHLIKQHCVPPINRPCMITVPVISFRGKKSCNGLPRHDSQYRSLVTLNLLFTWDLKSLTVPYGAKVNMWALPVISNTEMVVTILFGLITILSIKALPQCYYRHNIWAHKKLIW